MVITGGYSLSMARVGRHRRGAARTRAPRPLAAALEDLVRDLGIERPMHEYAAVTSWNEVVGEQISKIARAERVDKGVLVVRVSSAPWRSELSLRKAEILRKLSERVGQGIIREIRFR